MNNTGEALIMNMLAAGTTGQSRTGRQGVAVMTRQQSTPSYTGGLSDKAKLFEALGFEFNKMGDQLPNFKRTGTIVYKPRKASDSFLAGILTQTDPLEMPIMAPALMWVKSPVKAALKPSVWMLKRVAPGEYVGLHLQPSKDHTFDMARKEGRVNVTATFCTRWTIKAKPVPQCIVDVLETLAQKFRLPECITVDCLNNLVFDVHGKHEVQDINYNTASVLNIVFESAPDRPFFDLDINMLAVEERAADF